MRSRRLLVVALAAPLALAASRPAAAAKAATPPPDAAADVNKARADARRIAFETSDATWATVDVAPDGATLVFDLLGDLYSLPIAGGTAKRLTSGPAWDSQPRFSPDGRTIAFTSDRGGIENLWLADADGANPRALTEEKDAYVRTPDWTPDGEYLLARREEGKTAGLPPVELWLYHRRGGAGVKITSSDDLHHAAGPIASADGRFLYFAARQRPFNYIPNLQDGLWQIQRYDRTTAETTGVTEGIGGAGRPALSPDGRRLAYVSRRDGTSVLVLRELATGAERILLGDLSRDEMEGFAQADLYPGFDFTPDGAAIVLSRHHRFVRVDVGSGATTDVPFVAAVEQWAAPRVAWQEKVEVGDLRARILRRPTQSADGKWIVFDALGWIWKQALADGKPSGAPARLTSAAGPREYAPAPSPDGASVAWVSWSDAEGGHVWRAPLAGGAPVRLTREAGHYANPTWSPDGRRLAVLRGSGLELRGRQPEEEGSFEIRLVDAAASAPSETSYVATIGLGTGQLFHPLVAFSADGERLFHVKPVPGKKSSDEAKTDLISIRLDGSDRQVIARLPVASEVVPSPDGRWVAFTSRDTGYLAALPPLRTAEPPEIGLKEGPLPVWRLTDAAGVYLAWADGGRTLTWGLGDGFYRLPIADALVFAEAEKRRAAEKAKSEAASGEAKDEKKDGKAEADEPKLRLPRAEVVRLALVAPRPAPEGSFVLRGARVVTMRGDEVLERADVVVTGARIAAVGPAGSVAVPAGARELDAAGTTVIPGLIDTHAHLHYSAFEIYPEIKWEYLANLAYGVTTVYDPSAPTVDVFAQAELVEAGRTPGPRVYSSGMVLYGGQQTDIWAAVDGQEDADRQVRRMKAYGARMIKVYQQPRRAQRLWFAEACRKQKMLVTAEGAGELHTDLTMALDGYTAFEHSLPVELGDDVVRLLAATGTHYTPTLLVSYGGPWGELYYWQERNAHDDPKLNRFVPHFALDAWGRRHPWVAPEEYQFQNVAEGVAAVARAGGNVSLGAHGQLQGLGVHWELWAMGGENGRGKALAPHEALRAATLAAADKLGFAHDLGSVEAGKLADLVVLDADPLADLHASTKIRWVVKNGELWEAETMKRLWPVEQPPPRQYWQGKW